MGSGPSRILGRYALYSALSSGGMATVHIGRLQGPVGFARTVAIKRLHEQYATDPEFVSSFLDEARLAARIRHPNVVPTLDVVATEGQLFLVMEYVQGESLSRLLRTIAARHERVPPRIAVAILSGVLSGLHAAHEARNERGEPLRIVHRDMSPQNVMVGVDGVARVVDFGIAKAVGRLQSTREGQLKGKLAYMAPEQIENEQVDRRTDVYAASVVAWETLAAKRLFAADNDAALLARVLAGSIAPPSSIAPELAPLDAVVMRGLRRSAGERWQTAREMAVALEEAVSPATPNQVGAWVEQVAAGILAERAGIVADVESSDVSGERVSTILSEIRKTSGEPETQGTDRTLSLAASARPSRRSGRALAIGVAALAGMLGGSVLFAVARRHSATSSVATEPAAPSATAAPSPSRSEEMRPIAAPSSPAEPSASVSSLPVAASAPPRRSSHVVPRPSAPVSTVDCSTPYTFDQMGRKIFKKECFE